MDKKDKINNILNKQEIVAICYDFDRTLSPDDMQTFTLIPSFGMDAKTFWKEANELAKSNLMDKNLAWMLKLITESRFKNRPLKKQYFTDIGKDVDLFNGVDSWFDRINQIGKELGIQVQHYIISSGLKEIIQGTSIAEKFNRIYASSYYYDIDGIAQWPAQAVNYTNKTQFLFRIAKGIFEEFDDRVNDSMPDNKLYIPYENMIYIGDSQTDIPCMRLVKSKGGYSIGVYNPANSGKTNLEKLIRDGRIDYSASADYSKGAQLENLITKILKNVKTRSDLKKEHEILKIK